MKKRLVWVTGLLGVGFLLSACGGGAIKRERGMIRQGLLITRQHQDSFRLEWGPPTTTYSDSGDNELLRGSWMDAESQGHFPLRKGRLYDIWVYENRGVTLLFDREDLVGWKRAGHTPAPAIITDPALLHRPKTTNDYLPRTNR